MEFLRRQWAQVNNGLGGLSAEKKLIIGMGLVIMLTILVLVIVWAGNTSTQPLPFVGDRADEVVATLSKYGLEAELRNGQVYVSDSDSQSAVAVLMQEGLMTEDPSEAWSQLLGNQSPWETRDQAEERGRIAAQEYARGVIKAMRGVKDARVMLAPKPRTNFGSAYVRRNASVTVWMDSRNPIDPGMVEAIASFIAAADAEMRPTDVSVIDGSNGTAHKVDDPADVLPTKAHELAAQREREYKDKILELLAIPNLRVAVSVQVDAVQKQQSQEIGYEENQPLESEETENITRRETANAGEPGVRPNAGLSIDGGSQAGLSETIENTRTTFAESKITLKTDTLRAGHQTQKVNVSIGVPRAYFVQLHKSRNPDAEGEPDDAALAPLMQAKLSEFESRVLPIIEAGGNPGFVVTGVYEDVSSFALGGGGAATGVSGSIGAVMSGPLAQPAIATTLVVGVLALMFYMVRRATRPESLPSVEELAGLPPRLPADEEVVGEVDESEDVMAGFELDEKDLESRKIAEQISELIKGNPDEAGSLLGKWVKRDE